MEVVKEYHSNGKLFFKSWKKNGKYVKRKSWYNTGNRSGVYIFDHNENCISARSYNPDGTLKHFPIRRVLVKKFIIFLNKLGFGFPKEFIPNRR